MNSPFLNLLKPRKKEFLAEPNLRTSSRSIMGDSLGPQSFCLVLRYEVQGSLFCSIVQLDPPTPEMIKNKRKRIYAKWMSHFMEESTNAQPLPRIFSTPTSVNDDFYLLPDFPRSDSNTLPLYGAAFNCSTKTFQPIKQPHAYKFGGVAVTVRNHVYFMAHPSSYCHLKDPPDVEVFERYNPATQVWEPQVPFPFHDLRRFAYKGKIQAIAVWDDTTILLNIGGCEIWAYHVSYNQWYRVTVKEDKRGRYMGCFNIEGEAFVVKNTIYALSQHFGIVLALSIKNKGVGRDLQYSCAFRSELFVEPMEPLPEPDTFTRSSYLFPMGEDRLCFVRSCGSFMSVRTQPIQVSYIKRMEDGKMTLKDEYCYWVRLVDRQQFEIGSCFSLPDCKTPALKQCETFIFDPFRGTVSVGEPILEKEKVAVPKQGRAVIVINLPPDATAKQLEKKMKRFGHLKRDMIQLIKDTTGTYHCAIVVFESASARRRVVEESPIRIGGCRAKILKLKGTFSAKVDNNVASIKNLKRKRL